METISVKRGDTWTANFAYTDAAGDPIDITGASARMDIYAKNATAPAMSLSDATGELTINGAAGEIDLLVAYADMEDMIPGAYLADMEVTYSTGIRASSATFTVIIVEDITV